MKITKQKQFSNLLSGKILLFVANKKEYKLKSDQYYFIIYKVKMLTKDYLILNEIFEIDDRWNNHIVRIFKTIQPLDVYLKLPTKSSEEFRYHVYNKIEKIPMKYKMLMLKYGV